MANKSVGGFLVSVAGLLLVTGLICAAVSLAICGGFVMVGAVSESSAEVPIDGRSSSEAPQKNSSSSKVKAKSRPRSDYSLGDKVSLGNVTYCADAFFWSKDLHPDPIANEKADGRYLFIKVLVTNNGNEPLRIPSLRLVGDMGEVYAENESLFSAPHALNRSELLNSGVTRHGLIVFDVAQERTYRLELIDVTSKGNKAFIVIYDHKKEMAQVAKDGELVLASIEAEKKRRQEAESEEAAKSERIEQKKVRTWKSSDGKFSVVAKFVSMASGKVKLAKTSDGKEILVDLTDLCDADQAFIRSKSWLAE